MKFSVEVDNYNATSLTWCLSKLENSIPDFHEWRFFVNSGVIDYGIYLNIDADQKEITICNQPEGNGDDYLDDVIEYLKETYEDEE